MTSFCPYCGTQLSRPGVAFCAACGRSLTGSAAPMPGAPPPGPSPTNEARLSNQARLFIEQLGQPPQTFRLERPSVTIGRDVQNDLVINSPLVSRQHAHITRQGENYLIADLGSSNGTTVNGRQLSPRQPQRLQDRDIIRIGDQQGNSIGLTFQGTAVPGKVSKFSGTIHLGQLNLTQPLITIGRDPASQIHLDHPAVSRRHAEVRQTAQGHILHDLGSANGVFVNGQLARSARLLHAGDVVQIGPFKLVYDQQGFAQYTPAGNYRLDAQGLRREVTVGGFLTQFSGGATKKVILDDVSLAVQPREFVALVGGSGAGKSTLMKAMSGFTPADQGNVLVNGDDLYRNFAAYRSILGYVPQDDIIHGHLTVQSALTYAAQLRLPDASPQEVTNRISKALQDVEMTEHTEKQVNRLSGGQRKRVSIAVELLAEPGLFFLDEPTSGLDPGLEKKMMYTMRQLADGGRTIVLVTHATANIDQCTHVAFLAYGKLAYFGPPQEALGFFGAADFADIYTRLSQTVDPTTLPAQWQAHYGQMTAVNPQVTAADFWADCYRASTDYQRHVASRLQAPPLAAAAPVAPSVQQGQKVSSWQQFGVLTRRYFDLIRRDTLSLVILLAVMPVIGFLLLLMADKHDLVGKSAADIKTHIQCAIDSRYSATCEEEAETTGEGRSGDVQEDPKQGLYQVVTATQRVLFMVALAGSLLGLFAAAYEIVKEDAIYQRERMVNLRILPYLLSKTAVLALFALIQGALLLLVLRLKLEFPDNGVLLPAVLEMYITLFLATLASIALGLLISAVARSANTVIYMILLILFVQILFAGAIFEIPTAVRPISYLTTTRWALQALGSTVNMESLTELGGGCLQPDRPLPAGVPQPAATRYCEEGQTTLPAAFTFNVNYDSTAVHLLLCWAVLGAFAVLYTGLTVWVQKRKDVV